MAGVDCPGYHLPAALAARLESKEQKTNERDDSTSAQRHPPQRAAAPGACAVCDPFAANRALLGVCIDVNATSRTLGEIRLVVVELLGEVLVGEFLVFQFVVRPFPSSSHRKINTRLENRISTVNALSL
jgi:hypothetical protein